MKTSIELKRAVVTELSFSFMNLEEFLESKPLYYDKIDLERMPEAYEYIKGHHGDYRIIHIVGTNGKGSTGRILASLLRSAGMKVGHYTSPHILRFNERIWIDGEDASDALLNSSHEKLLAMLPKSVAESLSYFEYTTLLALVAFKECDIVVLEAGLGGEHDATSVTERELSVVTPIGFDHQEFLGESIEEIAATKLRCMAKDAVISRQPYEESIEIARKIAKERGSRLYMAEEILEDSFKEGVKEVCRKKGWPDFLLQNSFTAFAAVKIVTGTLLQPKTLESVVLKGRFERVASNVILDVGHNPLAARAVAAALDSTKPVLVYNALKDKDIKQVLDILAPHIKRVEIIEIDSKRAIDPGRLAEIVSRSGLKCSEFRGVNESEEYLVFGSFYVAEAFLKRL